MTLHQLVDEWDCSAYNEKNFFLTFYTKAMSFALQNLPISDALLCNCSFLNFETKDKCETCSLSQKKVL